MLPASLRRNVGRGAFNQLQQRLLDALSRYVTRDGRVRALPCDLVYLVDVDDAVLSLGNVVVGGLDEAEQDVLNVLPHVACFRQRSSVCDGERYIENLRQRLSKERLAGTGRPHEQDIALLDLHVIRHGVGPNALVVVVHRNAEHPLRPILPYDVLIEPLSHLFRRKALGQTGGPIHRRRTLFRNDLLAESNALIADKDPARASNEAFDSVLRLPAEAAKMLAVRRRHSGVARHRF